MIDSKKCNYNGGKCNAYALTGKDYCFSHDPDSKEAKHKAVVKGGEAKQVKVETPLEAIDISKPDDVVRLLSVTISEVRKGILPIKIANTIGFLSGHLLKAFQVSLEQGKIDELCAIFSEREFLKNSVIEYEKRNGTSESKIKLG